MEQSWQTKRELVQYVAAVYMILLFIFWLIRAKLPQQTRKIEAYDDFKERFAAAANQQILFIPGTTSIIDPEQTIIMSHCMRFLERHSNDLAQRELTLLVSCHGSIHIACADFSSLPDAMVVANATIIGEEL